MAATSGTVLTYPYDQRKVIDHAARRAGRTQSALVGEDLEIARDLIFTLLAEWITAGFPIWTRQYLLYGVTVGSPDVVSVDGTVEVMKAYWRQLNPWRGPATTTSGADASVLFGGQPNADLVIPGPNAGVIVNFGSATEVDTIGVLLGDSVSVTTTGLQVFTSADGVTYTLSQTLPTVTMQPGQWSYFDLKPAVSAIFVKLVLPGGAGGGVPILAESGLAIETEAGQQILTETGGSSASSWTLNQVNFGLANSTNIELGQLNMQDYYNLPNLFFPGERAVSCFIDRPFGSPVIKLWPTVNQAGFYNGCISALSRRYIQDPGAFTNGIEVQPRFLEALQWRLAQKLIHELPDEEKNGQPSYFTLMAKQQRIQDIEQNAAKAEALAWSGETTSGPIRIAPNIRGYTR